MAKYIIIKGTNNSYVGVEINIDNFVENSYIELPELSGIRLKINSISEGKIKLRNEHITLTGKPK